MFSLGQVDGQDAIGVAGLDPVRVNRSRKRERLLVLAVLEALPVNRRSFRNAEPGLPLQVQ